MATATDIDLSICQRIDCASREEWLEARRATVGASDSPVLFGEGFENQSTLTVWDSKVNPPREVGEEPARFRVGRHLEPALRSIFAEESGLPCVTPGEFTIFRSREHPFIGASLDGVAVHEEYGLCPVELKNVSNFAKQEWSGEEPPLRVQVQVQHQLAVIGASHGFVLGLIGGHEPVIKTVARNDRFIQQALLVKLAEFWQYVEARELPPVDESAATARLLNLLWPKDSGTTVMLPVEADQWAEELENAKADLSNAEFRKSQAENRIKAAIGEATFGVTPGGVKFSWKQQSRKEHVVQACEFRVLRKCK